MYGLLEKDLHYLHKAFRECENISKVVLFGSKAMGNHKKGSDVDLAIFSSNPNKKDLAVIKDKLEEIYPLPYFFDIIYYSNIKNPKLKEHIDTHGKIIYKK